MHYHDSSPLTRHYQIYHEVIDLESRTTFGNLSLVCQYLHKECYDVLLRRHLFVKVIFRCSMPIETIRNRTYSLNIDPRDRDVSSGFTKASALDAFPQYHLRIVIGESPTKSTTMMLVGIDRLVLFCRCIAARAERVATVDSHDMALLRNLPIRLLFNEKTMSRSAWQESTILTAFVGHGLPDGYYSKKALQRMKLDTPALSIGSWWDMPHVTIHDSEDQTLARAAEEYIASRRWSCPKEFFDYMHEQFQNCLRFGLQGTCDSIARAMVDSYSLGVIVQMMRLSNQAVVFLEGDDRVRFAEILDFFAIVCPLMASHVTLRVLQWAGRDSHASQPLRTIKPSLIASAVTFAGSAVEAMTNSGAHETWANELHGIAVLYVARGCEMRGEYDRATECKYLARLILGHQYDVIMDGELVTPLQVPIPETLLEWWPTHVVGSTDTSETAIVQETEVAGKVL